MEELEYRKANKKDVEWIVQLLAADPMGRKREEYADPLPEAYYKAFDRIEGDPNQELMVLLVKDEIIGTFQLSFLPYLTYKGGIRCQVERSEEHTSELQSRENLVCRLLLEKKKQTSTEPHPP